MIWESAPWKDRLLKDADLIERWSLKTHHSERRDLLLEQKIMLSAYTIRKLAHSHKLSNATTETTFHCNEFEAKSAFITVLNTHKIDQNYDLESPSERCLPATLLVNSIIHSYSFILSSIETNQIDGFFVTSDFDRLKWIRAVDLSEYIRFMRLVGNDYPAVGIRVFDPDLNDYQMWQGNEEPPENIRRELDKIAAAQKVRSKGRKA